MSSCTRFPQKYIKNRQKNCDRRQGGRRGGIQRRCFLHNTAKSVRKVGNFSEMEDVSGKKILDFSGRMVHNEFHPIGRNRQMCCKTHMIDAKPEGRRRRLPDLARRYETARRRICWKAGPPVRRQTRALLDNPCVCHTRAVPRRSL